jgi:3-oxoacyl-[acyl-carrier protein] reductase
MDLGLQGRIALVTRGSKGIGKVSVLGLAREGADVAICARGQFAGHAEHSDRTSLYSRRGGL